jgi:hypothetical protein
LVAPGCSNVWAASGIAGSGSPEELLAMVAYACISLVVTSLIETVVYGWALRLSLGKAIQLSGLVNLASTVGCVPLGILLGGSEHALIPLAARWGWSAFALMLTAWAIETFVARWRLPNRPLRSLALPALFANASSYGLYFLLRLAL